MVRSVIQVETGSSNTGMNKRTVAGALLGSKQSSNQLGKYLFAPNKRVYKRNKTVWECKNCAGIGEGTVGGALHSVGQTISEILSFIFNITILFLVVLFVYSCAQAL